MTVALYFPRDEATPDVAADYLELTSFFSESRQSFTKDLVNALEISAEEDYDDVDDELEKREEIISQATGRILSRKAALGDSYPFSLDEAGNLLTCKTDELTLGQATYLLCLILSHLKSVSPILNGTEVYPTDAEVTELRRYFQYFATAALAGEVGGQAWSFGHPRPDHTGFLTKLNEIWGVLKDGMIDPDPSAPKKPQDDQIDIFAWKGHLDGLPGFLLAGAQVATGANWKEKSIKSHLTDVFWKRWFSRHPVSQLVCYHMIPFARLDSEFRDDVLVLGNVLHRIRMPRRVEQAVSLHENGVPIEAFDLLPEAINWLTEYSRRGEYGEGETRNG